MGDFSRFALKFLSYTGLPVLLSIMGLSLWLGILTDRFVLLALIFFSVIFLGSTLALHEGSFSRKIAESPTKQGSLKERFKRWWKEGYEELDRKEPVRSDRSRSPRQRGKALEQKPRTLEREEAILEHSFSKKARGKALETPARDRVLMSRRPSKKDLEALGKALSIEKGCLQYKRKGEGIYLVTYNSEKKGYDWKHLGSWAELRHEAELKDKMVNPEAIP